MPELPEVERATRFVKAHAQGKTITRVDTNEDTIVFSGTTHTEFAKAVKLRKVKDVQRYGKVFFLVLEGDGPMPVFHFGMTGNILIKGEDPLYYKEGPKKGDSHWPPRFTKFILHLPHLIEGSASSTDSDTQIAFVDPRRLGRIRLCNDPMKEPPISHLGFDPILSMPTLEQFSIDVLKRSCPVKALLLDQSFSAGVGNWVADEILYHSHVHPEQKCSSLTNEQLSTLHRNTFHICQMAVSVNADSNKFPADWLFNHRWGKGKKRHQPQIPLSLPSGQPATIKWVAVGGRTSAFVTELQTVQLSNSKPDKKIRELDEESPLTSHSESEEAEARRPVRPKKHGLQECHPRRQSRKCRKIAPA